MVATDSDSLCSDTTSLKSAQTFDRIYAYSINTRSILNDQLETITNRYLANSAYIRQSIPSSSVKLALEKLKERQESSPKSNRVAIVFDENNIRLTEEDLKLNANEDDEDDSKKYDNDFEKFYGTSINVQDPEDKSPYLVFNSPPNEMQEKLDKLLEQNSSKQLSKKITLAEDIEQQFAIQSFRVSRRQRKKENASRAKETLPNWFDMPRVTEITKEQEKDLLALKMRRTWDPKQFYKKRSMILGGTDTARYFQVGTVVESSADFYNSRIAKKDRKQTIVDELMEDATLRAYNKRKLSYAMNKNSRLRIMMKRAKLRRQKQKIRERKAIKKGLSPNGPKRSSAAINGFTTYEL